MPLENNKLTPSPDGIYHAATVCCPGAVSIGNFEFMAGKSIVWIYVFNVWLNERHAHAPTDPGIRFTAEPINDIWFNSTNCIPFVRMVPRSRRHNWRHAPEPLYSVERIARGEFDDMLSAWGESAKQFGRPMLVEFGAEMNGDWQPWNASHNGKNSETGETAPDGKPRYLGQKLYRDAHIRLIKLYNDLGVQNITWVFHVNHNDNPDEEWNRMAGYYPGDEHIDWIGVSCYAAHEFGPLTPLKELLDPAIAEIRNFSQGVCAGIKPIALAELGAIDYPQSSKADWIRDSYQLLADGIGAHGLYRDQIKAVSWWDESWWDESWWDESWWDESWWEGPKGSSPPFLQNNGISSSPASVAAYRKAVDGPLFVAFL